MMNITTSPAIKECRECGCEFFEKQESIHYECEHCVGKYEE